MTKRTCVRRTDGALVHRTRPLYLRPKNAVGKVDRKHPGYFVGHVCDCREVVLTENSHQSVPTQWRGVDVQVRVPIVAHARRVQAASQA